MDELSRAGDLGLDEAELSAMADGLSPGLIDGLCEALVRFSEALDEVGA